MAAIFYHTHDEFFLTVRSSYSEREIDFFQLFSNRTSLEQKQSIYVDLDKKDCLRFRYGNARAVRPR